MSSVAEAFQASSGAVEQMEAPTEAHSEMARHQGEGTCQPLNSAIGIGGDSSADCANR